MLRRILGHVRHNVVGYIALFIALSGTAYAAKPMITGADVQDGSLTDADIAAANKDGTATTPSLRTLGTGAQQAAAGSDPRFSHAASASLGVAPGADPQSIATTTITTPTSGKLLVNGKDMRARVSCFAAGSCAATLGLSVDGQPIPGSAQRLSADAGSSVVEPVVVYGVMDGVAAGTHTVDLVISVDVDVSSVNFGGPQVEAISVGG